LPSFAPHATVRRLAVHLGNPTALIDQFHPVPASFSDDPVSFEAIPFFGNAIRRRMSIA